MSKTSKMIVQGNEIAVITQNGTDYISLTNLCKGFDGGSALIEKWLSNKSTIEYLSIWETLNNQNFNSPEFGGILEGIGSNTFYMSVKKWVSGTNAVGIVAKTGSTGGTYAHKDIALKFGSYLSPAFELYINIEFQRLKEVENNEFNLEWNVKRVLSKINNHVHTDAIQKYVIPTSGYAKDKEWIAYATEADLVNVALYGFTAKEWKEANPNITGNMRDHSSINQLTVMANLLAINAQMMKHNTPKETRFRLLQQNAKETMEQLSSLNILKSIMKQNESTFIDIKNMSHDQIESETKKNILEANRQNLSDFNKKLKQGLDWSPKKENPE